VFGGLVIYGERKFISEKCTHAHTHAHIYNKYICIRIARPQQRDHFCCSHMLAENASEHPLTKRDESSLSHRGGRGEGGSYFMRVRSSSSVGKARSSSTVNDARHAWRERDRSVVGIIAPGEGERVCTGEKMYSTQQ